MCTTKRPQPQDYLTQQVHARIKEWMEHDPRVETHILENAARNPLDDFKHFNAATKEEVSEKWAEGLTYRGIDVFENYGDRVWDMSTRELRRMDISDSQESLLVYLPQYDLFITGFDVWTDEGGEGAWIAYYLTPEGYPRIVGSDVHDYMMYGSEGFYNRLEEEGALRLIEIRLD